MNIDDLKFYNRITDIDDCKNLQGDLNYLYDYCVTNKLILNKYV